MAKKKQVLLMMNARKFLGVIVQYAAQHNWRFTLMNDGIAPRGWKGDGALVSFSRSKGQMDFIVNLAKGPIPVVGLSYARPDIKIPRAIVDFGQNAKLAAEYLYSKGYRQFALCTGERIKSTEIAYEAFVVALRAKGVCGKIPWVVRSEMIRKGREEDWDENIRAFTALFDGAVPLGVWCMSDSVAAHVLESAVASGRDVPGEVGVLGSNDNVMVCENQDVTISSVNPDFRTLAITACEMLDRLMDGKSLEDEFKYIPALGVSERESTVGAFGKNSHLKSILQYLSDNSAEAVSVKDIAVRFNMSESALHRLFRDELKSTPLSELRSLRLQKAKSLLRTTDFTLEYIAKSTGFLHASHLVNAFRSTVGLTPAEWRRQWM